MQFSNLDTLSLAFSLSFTITDYKSENSPNSDSGFK